MPSTALVCRLAPVTAATLSTGGPKAPWADRPILRSGSPDLVQALEQRFCLATVDSAPVCSHRLLKLRASRVHLPEPEEYDSEVEPDDARTRVVARERAQPGECRGGVVLGEP